MTNATVSAIYRGVVTHRRVTPKHHFLRYRLFQLWLDLDDLPALGRRLRLFAHNRFAPFSFHDRDHGAGRPGGLRAHIEGRLALAGIDLAGGPIRVLCMPRVLGYVFNPLTLFYCWRASGELAAVLLAVNNTFGQRHGYLIRTGGEAVVRASTAKRFFVSPFLGMDMVYDFHLTTPGATVATAIQGRGLEGAPIIAAAFAGERRPLTDRALAAAFFAYPLMTLKVIGGIHWEALKLLAKGVGLRPRPPAPAHPVTILASEAVAPAGQDAEAERLVGSVACVGGGPGLQPQEAERVKVAVGV